MFKHGDNDLLFTNHHKHPCVVLESAERLNHRLQCRNVLTSQAWPDLSAGYIGSSQWPASKLGLNHISHNYEKKKKLCLIIQYF